MEENNELKEEIAKVQEQKPKKDKKNIIIVCLIVVILLLIALLTFVLLNNDKKESNSGKTDKTDKTEVDEKKDDNNNIKEETEELIKDATYIDLKVKNLGASKDYKIQLVRKNTESSYENQDGTIYAYYNKTDKQMITDFDYSNVTCGGKCSDDAITIGCVEKNNDSYLFSMNNKDYLYAYVSDLNYCGGVEGQAFLYNLTDRKIEFEKTNATKDIFITKDSFVLRIANAGDDIVAPWEEETVNPFNGRTAGFLFGVGNNSSEIMGNATMIYESKYYVVRLVNEKNNELAIDVYDQKGTKIETIDKVVAYNEDYYVLRAENKFNVFNLSKKLVGSINFDDKTYSSTIFNPFLSKEDDKLQLEYVKVEDKNNHLYLYCNLK